MLLLPLFVTEKLFLYYSLSFGLKGVNFRGDSPQGTEDTEENFFIVKNHKLLFITEVTLSHPYDRRVTGSELRGLVFA